jgi:uncharacterized protein (TIGR02145 family)
VLNRVGDLNVFVSKMREKSIILFIIFTISCLSACKDKDKVKPESQLGPECMIVAPQNYSFFGKGEIIDIIVDADDQNGNTISVQLFINNEGVSSTSEFPFQFEWDSHGLEPGEYSLKTVAIDLDGLRCKDSIQVIIGISSPRLTTEDVFDVSLTSVTLGGSILTDGGSPIFETGIYYGLNEHPEHGGMKQTTSLVSGQFKTVVTGLGTNTTYFYTAYAVNEVGENRGEQKKFKTLGNELGVFTDVRDGKEYKTVRIANQTWMAENLAYLPSVTTHDDGSKYIPKYYVYGYNGTDTAEAKLSEYYSNYGALYNYEAALKSCPEGWHLPSDEEWKTLEANLGMQPIEIDNAGWRGTNEGRSLKARYGWKESGSGSNISDFSALPGGYRLPYGYTDFETIYSNFWVAREHTSTEAWCRYLYYNNTGVYRGTFSRDFGFSVRCIRD